MYLLFCAKKFFGGIPYHTFVTTSILYRHQKTQCKSTCSEWRQSCWLVTSAACSPHHQIQLQNIYINQQHRASVWQLCHFVHIVAIILTHTSPAPRMQSDSVMH